MRDEISLAGRAKQGGKLTQSTETRSAIKTKITILKNNNSSYQNHEIQGHI